MMSHIQWPVEKQVLNTFRCARSSNRPESIDYNFVLKPYWPLITR